MTKADDIFERLKRDHDKHRELIGKLEETSGESAEREDFFVELMKELKGHAAAEEQALYSTMLRKSETNDSARHSVAEHHEIDELLNDLAATKMSEGAWLIKFRSFSERYIHHIDEEEDEHFKEFARHLDQEDEEFMARVFERRKRAEKAAAEVTPERKEDAKE